MPTTRVVTLTGRLTELLPAIGIAAPARPSDACRRWRAVCSCLERSKGISMRVMETVTIVCGALALLILVGGVIGSNGAPQEAAAAAIAMALVGIPYCITATLQRRALLKKSESQ